MTPTDHEKFLRYARCAAEIAQESSSSQFGGSERRRTDLRNVVSWREALQSIRARLQSETRSTEPLKPDLHNNGNDKTLTADTPPNRYPEM